MAIAHVKSNIVAGASSTAPACSFLAGGTATANNLLVTGAYSASNAALTAPAGWTPGTLVTGGSGGTANAFGMAYKVAAGGETTATWTSGANVWDCWIAEYSGVAIVSPLDVQNAVAITTAGTVKTVTVTGATAGERLVVLGLAARGISSFATERVDSSTTGVTERQDVGTSITLALADFMSASLSAGSHTGDGTAGSLVGAAGIMIFKGASAVALHSPPMMAPIVGA